MVEHHLGESLARGGGTEIGVESERLLDGKVGLDVEEGSAGALRLLEDVTSSAGKDRVDTTHGVLGNLDLDKEDGLEETGVGEEGCGVEDTTSGRDDLTTTTVNGIGVEGNIHDVEADGAHGLLGNGTFLGSPLETRDNGILDFVEVLDGLGLVNQQVGTVGVGTEAPNLTGVSDIPSVLVGEDTGAGLEVVTRSDLAGLDVLGNLLGKSLGGHVDTVVLVGRLGQSGHARHTTDSLAVLDDGVRDAERDTGVVLLEILQADLQVELTGTSNNVLTGGGDESQDARVGLGETLKTLDELGKIVGVLDLDGALDNGRDGELHDLHVVGSLGGGESTRLEQELIDTNKTKNVTGGHIINGLGVTTHHENGALDRLDEEILLAARGVVGALDADLETGTDGTGEDTTEGVETTLVGRGHHLGDVKHESSLGVTVTDGNGSLVVVRTLVESLHAVLLGSNGRRKMENHHLEESIGGRKELLHDNLEELLALEGLLVTGKLDLELLKKSSGLLLLEVHDGSEDAEDGVKDELVERALDALTTNLGPLLGLGVEEVVSLLSVLVRGFGSANDASRCNAYPETVHHLALVDTKLLGVTRGELTDGEGPAVKTGTKGNGTLLGVDLHITEDFVVVGRDDDVDGLDDTREVLVEILLGELELEKSAIDLVDDDNRLDTLTESLTEDSLGLHAHTLDGVDDDESTVSDTESGGDLR